MAEKKIILFGGTFDPIHSGHIQVAEAAKQWISAGRVILVPAKRSPHKKRLPQVSDEDRMEMIRRAIAGRESFSLSDCELKRPQPSYTLDTVLDFRRHLGPQASLYWLVGADAVKDLPKWYQIKDLLESCTVAVMYRAGYPKPDFEVCGKEFTPSQIRKLEQNVVPVPLVDISSTDIRSRLSKGQDVSDRLAPPVAEYIRSRGLYR